MMAQVLLTGVAPRGEEPMQEQVNPEGLQPGEGPSLQQGKVGGRRSGREELLWAEYNPPFSL